MPDAPRVPLVRRRLQDWEKAVARKLAEHWRHDLELNPMANATYSELSVSDRVRRRPRFPCAC